MCRVRVVVCSLLRLFSSKHALDETANPLEKLLALLLRNQVNNSSRSSTEQHGRVVHACGM